MAWAKEKVTDSGRLPRWEPANATTGGRTWTEGPPGLETLNVYLLHTSVKESFHSEGALHSLFSSVKVFWKFSFLHIFLRNR